MNGVLAGSRARRLLQTLPGFIGMDRVPLNILASGGDGLIYILLREYRRLSCVWADGEGAVLFLVEHLYLGAQPGQHSRDLCAGNENLRT